MLCSDWINNVGIISHLMGQILLFLATIHHPLKCSIALTEKEQNNSHRRATFLPACAWEPPGGCRVHLVHFSGPELPLFLPAEVDACQMIRSSARHSLTRSRPSCILRSRRRRGNQSEFSLCLMASPQVCARPQVSIFTVSPPVGWHKPKAQVCKAWPDLWFSYL